MKNITTKNWYKTDRKQKLKVRPNNEIHHLQPKEMIETINILSDENRLLQAEFFQNIGDYSLSSKKFC